MPENLIYKLRFDESSGSIGAPTTGSGYIPPLNGVIGWGKTVRPFISKWGVMEMDYGGSEFDILSVWRDRGFMESSAGLVICGIAIGFKVTKYPITNERLK